MTAVNPPSSFSIEQASGGLSGRFPQFPCLLAAAGIAACTWISFRLGLTSGSVGCFYLVFVVLTAYYGGLWQATLISVTTVGCLDYYFNTPVLSFSVGKPADWVELGAFEFTALVISRLSNRVRLREVETASERRDTSRLYQTARRILLLESPGNTGNEVVSLVCDLFDLKSAVLFDAVSAETWCSGQCEIDATAQAMISSTHDAYYRDADACDASTRYCVLRLGVQPVGALALRGATMTGLTASAIASLMAIALERARSHERRCHAEAAREAEQLRTAVLDALAHKFKTPVTVIRTAAAGLPAAGNLSALQTELVSLIDQEGHKLNDLASRLLETPTIESKEFEPRREPLLLSRLAKSAAGELEQQSDRNRFQFTDAERESPVLADRELILTALAQMMDNALKYSFPGTPIEVRTRSGEGDVVLRIRSNGLEVRPDDRQRIFERFYRAPGARQFASGSGLGLSIVKTIAMDHAGHVWADSEPGYGSVFFLSLPIPQEFLS